MPGRTARGAALTIWRVGAALATLVILAATLTPGRRDAATAFWCLLCGERAASDAIRNVLLFLPLGLLLRLGSVSARRAILAGAVLSGFIELSQNFIPGRDPSLSDIMANTLGMAVGAWAAGLPRAWLVPAPARAVRLALTWCALVAGLFVSQRWLLAPALPESLYYGQWVPQLGHLAWYGGSVRQARVGNLALPDGPLGASREIRAALQSGDTLAVEAVAGPRVGTLAPIFSMADEGRREIVLAGADGEDLVFRYRTRASRFRLEPPAVRLRGVLRDMPGGADFSIRAWNIGADVCLRVNEQQQCTEPSPARAWTLVIPEGWLDASLRPVMNVVWMVCLALPACCWLFLGIRRVR